MASGPMTSWQVDGEKVETVADFIFWAPKSLKMLTAAMKLKDVYSLVIIFKISLLQKKMEKIIQTVTEAHKRKK